MAEDHPVVGEVRGRGLMLGIELVGPDGEPNPAAAIGFMQACRERGVLVGKGGINANTVRISPPLTITREAAEEAANVFEEALAAIGSRERVG
jgi:4-aminobutyrate aminotransferase